MQFNVTLDSSTVKPLTITLDVGPELGNILQAIAAKLDQLVTLGAKLMTQQQASDLIANVKDVKQATDDMSVRIDKIVGGLPTSDPVVAQAVIDLKAEAATLRGFHADTVIPPVGP